MEFCWVTIQVSDMKASLAFYQDILGLTVNRRMQPNPDMEIVFLGSGKTEIELIHNARNTDPEYGRDISLGFIIDSVETQMKLLKEHHIDIAAGPFQPNPHIRFFYVLDPNGVNIQFVENMP